MNPPYRRLNPNLHAEQSNLITKNFLDVNQL
jgi:hypothetical protein